MSEVSDFTIAILKFSFLALLWLFVFSAVGVMRRDLFGSPETAPARTRGGSGSVGVMPEASSRPTAGGRPPSHVVIVQGEGAGTSIALGQQPLTIGRGGHSGLVIADDYASTHHARLYCRGAQWFAEDLNSTNGTFIGRMRVDGPTPVAAGTQLRIGNTVLELRK